MFLTVFYCFSHFYAHEQITFWLFYSQKTSNSPEKPKSELTTLSKSETVKKETLSSNLYKNKLGVS